MAAHGDPKQTTRGILREYGLAVSVAVGIAVLIRVFLFEAYRIPTPVMHPTLEPGDLIFVAKWPYGIRFPVADVKITDGDPPARGDVVIYRSGSEGGKNYIKRVVGIAGMSALEADLIARVNGKALPFQPGDSDVCGTETQTGAEGTVSYQICIEPPVTEDFGPEKIPEGHVFLLGDFRNREASTKSFEIVPVDKVLSRAAVIWLSVNPAPKGNELSAIPRIRFERIFRVIR